VAAPQPNSNADDPDPSRLEFDQLLTRLVDRADELRATQGRMCALLAADRAIISELTVPAVLRHVVDAARELIGARYAALGVITSDGHIADFVHAGMPREAVERIGRLPQGKGLLGALIDDPRPIRLARIGDDPRSSGLPAGYPRIESFLGVPIRVGGEMFGNLYLADSEPGRFTAEDEKLVLTLAATAGVAIEKARLYEMAQLRQAWLRALAEITRQLLAGAAGQPLQVIADYTRDIADADVVAILLRARDGLQVDVAAGMDAERIAGLAVPVVGSLTEAVLTSGEPVRVGCHHERRGIADTALDGMDIGPLLVVPLRRIEHARGVLIAARTPGRIEFSAEELDMAAAFANQASLAVELAEARDEVQRTVLHDERDRIAAGLHDHVIQRLFVAGLTLQGVASALDPGPIRERVLGTIGDLDEAIIQIRTTIFAMHRLSGPPSSSLRGRLLDVVNDLTPDLGFSPAIRFTGLLDETVPPDIADDLLAVLRETLTDIARDASATSADVAVTGRPSHLTLDVTDNGSDLGAAMRRRSLKELQVRTERLGGTLTVAPREVAGTHLSWSVPIP
jgi:GAF domain-containing protein